MEEINEPHFLNIISGNNFSGRSSFLKSLAEDSDGDEQSYLYIGELPFSYISGIFPTVRDEINLHLSKAHPRTVRKINALFSRYNFWGHEDKNPFVLSGGEQVVLVVLCALLLEPSILAIDSTLEQLSEEWRNPLLRAFQDGEFDNTTVFMADNRFQEYELDNYDTFFPEIKKIDYKWKFKSPILNLLLKSEMPRVNIDLKNLSFAYRKNYPILNQIELNLEHSSIYHLKGTNGCGKSTLAKILGGILKKGKGEYLVNSKKYNAYRYPGQLVGYSFQNPDEQLFASTVGDEILYPLRKESEEYSERRETVLQIFGLQNLRDVHPGDLPFAMRKRIAIAATLAVDRPWYIFDEPTLGQDNNFVRFLAILFRRLANQGKGIIIISHSEIIAQKIKMKNLYLHNGSLNF